MYLAISSQTGPIYNTVAKNFNLDSTLSFEYRFVLVRLPNSAPYEKSKSLGSGGSMVVRLKLKGIDGRAPPRAFVRNRMDESEVAEEKHF